MTREELIALLLEKGHEERDCEGCKLEVVCHKFMFYCGPFYRLVHETTGGDT